LEIAQRPYVVFTDEQTFFFCPFKFTKRADRPGGGRAYIGDFFEVLPLFAEDRLRRAAITDEVARNFIAYAVNHQKRNDIPELIRKKSIHEK
jgi:hypothetical protein